jgi:hypothetical protein
MEVIGNESPGIDLRSRLTYKPCNAVYKSLPVLIVFEDRAPFDASHDDMMEGSFDIETRLARHGYLLPLVSEAYQGWGR